MLKKLLDYIIVTLTLICISGTTPAQEIEIRGINLGAKVGGSKLLGEFSKGSSGMISEFDNKFGIATGFEISKFISTRWEISGEVSYSVLKGDSNSPQFTAEGKHPVIPENLEDPVEYQNNLLGYNILFRYYFKPANIESAFIPFIGAGVGYIKYNSVFKYKDAPENETIFTKGKDSWTLSTPGFYLGTGFKSHLSPKLYLLTSLDFKFVSYDFLDVMHNYNADGTRQKITGLYTEIKVGIFFNITASGNSRNNKNKSKNNQNRGYGTSYLPFSR